MAATTRQRQEYWLAAGLAIFFLIPLVLTDLVSINRDLYYGVYVGAVFGFVALWLRYANGPARAVLTRHWRAGLGLGASFVLIEVAIVLKEPATSRPDGLEFAAAIVWRGVLYGLADGLILSVFPILAVFAAFAGTRAIRRRRGKVAVGALALSVSVLFTAVYHVGYSDFRGEKVGKPIAGDLVWSLPTLLTLSPLASPITHAGLHVSAVVHSYNTDLVLPPHKPAGNAQSTASVAPAINVKVFAPRGGPGVDCTSVYPLRRTVARRTPLAGALRALVAGPTAAERRRGYGGWFTSKTARVVRSVAITAGVAFVDFRDFSRLIPNASSSCGSALLLAQLDKTATQFPTARRAVYSFNGNRQAFYAWLQRETPAIGAR